MEIAVWKTEWKFASIVLKSSVNNLKDLLSGKDCRKKFSDTQSHSIIRKIFDVTLKRRVSVITHLCDARLCHYDKETITKESCNDI